MIPEYPAKTVDLARPEVKVGEIFLNLHHTEWIQQAAGPAAAFAAWAEQANAPRLLARCLKASEAI